ncbi:radical SAM protein [bacterium]|nr:radical SAM protein [bacterium]
MRHLSRIIHTVLSGPDRMLPRARLWARPLRIHLAINDYCNIRCPHCLRHTPSVPVNRGGLSVADLRRLVPWFRSAHFVALAGLGEPFIQKDLFDVIGMIHAEGAAVSIITNGTLLDEKAARKLVGHKLTVVNFSIDAGTREVFNRVRLGADFDKVVANIDRLVELKRRLNVPFPVMAINMTLMRDTLAEIEAVIDLAARWDIHLINAQTVMSLKDTPDRSQDVTNLEAQEALARAEPYARRAWVEIRYLPLSSDFETLAKDEEQGDLYAPGYRYRKTARKQPGVKGFYCPSLWNQMYVGVDGHMMYCCMADAELRERFGPIGRIQDADPGDLWNHEKVVNLRRSLLQGNPPEECRKCYALEQFGRRKTASMWRTEFTSLKGTFYRKPEDATEDGDEA